MGLPRRQTAVVADEAGHLVVSTDVTLPVLEPDSLLVETAAVAVNPSDAKLTGLQAAPGAVAGSDCAGTVVAVGDAVGSRFQVGDRVCAPTLPMDPLAPRAGAFANYVVLTADFALKIPNGMSFERAASLGTGLATAGYALFRSLRIPGHPDTPATSPAVVLVWGGSTATGTLAIQMIRRSGCIPIATCSRQNFALVESRGAEKVFDYHDVECAASIKAYTHNALDYALDCICDATSMQACYSAIGRAGGSYTTLEPFPQHLHTRKRVRPEWILGVCLLGRKIGWKEPYNLDADPKLREFGREWFQCVQGMLNRDEIQPHAIRTEHKKQGFEGVLEGVALLRKKVIRGEKLVYSIL
ncbi:GroES-like protein [Xylaria arbuscula]|nr:GroES-like protein [Xylaria arbuscula]